MEPGIQPEADGFAKRFRTVFENVADGMVTCSLDGSFLQVNLPFCEMLGYTESELLRMKISDVVPEDDRADTARRLEELGLGGSETLEIENRYVSKSGEAILRHTTAVWLEGSRETPGCFVGAVRSLAAHGAERQAMAMVGQLTGGIASDFNDLLTAISGYGDLLLERLAEDSPLRREVAEINRAASRAASLTQRLLAISRRQISESEALGLDAVVSDADAAFQPSPERNEPSSEAARPLRGATTVLLVEDDDAVRGLTHEILEIQGFRVIEAVNGVDALEKQDRYAGPIDVLLTDVVMPGMGGFDLVRKLVPLRPETRVIFMSGYAEDAAAHRAALETGTTYLQKPFTPDELGKRLRDVIGTAAA